LHEVAFVELQFNTDALPDVTLEGESVTETVGPDGALVVVPPVVVVVPPVVVVAEVPSPALLEES
jgi:hypothetical protein